MDLLLKDVVSETLKQLGVKLLETIAADEAFLKGRQALSSFMAPIETCSHVK